MRGQKENEMLEIREEIAKILVKVIKADRKGRQTEFDAVDQILSIKTGNHTLKELIEIIDKGELVKLAKDQSLPEVIKDIMNRRIINSAIKILMTPDSGGYHWVRVEPLK